MSRSINQYLEEMGGYFSKKDAYMGDNDLHKPEHKRYTGINDASDAERNLKTRNYNKERQKQQDIKDGAHRYDVKNRAAKAVGQHFIWPDKSDMGDVSREIEKHDNIKQQQKLKSQQYHRKNPYRFPEKSAIDPDMHDMGKTERKQSSIDQFKASVGDYLNKGVKFFKDKIK